MPEDILKNLTYSMQERTKKIIGLKYEYNSFKVIDFNLYVVIVLLIVSICSLALQSNSSNISINNYVVPIVITIGCSGYFYARYNSRIKKKDKLKENYDNLRKDMISCIDNQFHFEFCNHNQKCKCREEYIKYMKSNYDIDLIFK